MKEKNHRNSADHRAALPSDWQPDLPDVPILILSMLYQLLTNLRRVRPLIRRTRDGDYALIIESRPSDDGLVDRLAIMLTEQQLKIGGIIEGDSPDDDIEVEAWLEMGLGSAEMLEEAVHAAACVGANPEHAFADTIAALRRQEDPRLSRLCHYLRRLSPDDIRDELRKTFQA